MLRNMLSVLVLLVALTLVPTAYTIGDEDCRVSFTVTVSRLDGVGGVI